MDSQHLEALYPEDSRKKEIGEILHFVKEAKSCQLIAMPGVGRGNLLGFLSYNRNVRIQHLGENEQTQYHFVLCNFSEVKNRSLFDVMKFIFLELSSSLHERKKEEEFLVVDKLFKDALSYNDELVLFQGLKNAIDFLAGEKQIHIVLLLERFETYIPSVTAEFFTNLRSIRAHAKYKFSVVFSVTRPLEDSLDPTLLADFYEFIADNHIYLSLSDTPGTTFRLQYLEKLTGKKISKEILQSILELTGGHGKLTRLSLETAFANQDTKITQEFLFSQKTIQGALLEIWYFLTPDEQQDVLSLQKDPNHTLENIFLEKIGLVQNNKITIPLFENFLKDRQNTTQTQTKIVFDPQTDEIKKGDLILSKNLTISEFRLLRFLLEHATTIITREELVQAVWTDSKSQAGVSEQAVDQLVFRVRKKIEDDPNHPIHIQTIKGRGVTFTP